LDLKLIATPIAFGKLVGVSCRRVQGLVDVSYEVDDVAKGVGSLKLGLASILEDGQHAVDRDEGVLRVRLHGRALSVCPEVEIDVVPGTGFLPLRSHVVGPRRGGDEIVGTIRGSDLEQALGFEPDLCFEISLGDASDNHVASGVPGVRGGGEKECGDQERALEHVSIMKKSRFLRSSFLEDQPKPIDTITTFGVVIEGIGNY
jgi:hypothetical protein